MAVPECKKEEKAKVEIIPPDGGYGWVIVASYVLSAVVFIPIIQNFGLIYKDRMLSLGLSSTDITFIISLNSSIGQILGVFQGPFLKAFGFRPLAIFGVSFFCIGTFANGFAMSLTTFIICHGILTSIGFTYSLTAFSLAVNAYFRKKRSYAQGILMALQGLGPIIMPFLVTFLLPNYGLLGTTAILAALNANGIAAALLLHPVEQHGKKKEVEKTLPAAVEDDKFKAKSIHADSDSMYSKKFETSSRRPSSNSSISANNKRFRSISSSDQEEAEPLRNKHRSTSNVYNDGEEELAFTNMLSMRAKGALIASIESLGAVLNSEYPLELMDENEEKEQDKLDKENTTEPEKQKKWYQRWGAFLVKAFDLDLLKDPIYIIITLGLSIAVIGELIFSILTPFVVGELGLDINQTALFMSIVAISDIASRLLAPHIGKLLKLNSRFMFLLSLFGLVLTRASLLLVTTPTIAYLLAGGVGFAKGIRTVFWVQVLPDYVPIEKLGSAMSLQNLINGILVLFAGPMGGKIVEINHSYLNIIHFSNSMTATCITLWTTEAIISKCKGKKEKKKGKVESVN